MQMQLNLQKLISNSVEIVYIYSFLLTLLNFFHDMKTERQEARPRGEMNGKEFIVRNSSILFLCLHFFHSFFG